MPPLHDHTYITYSHIPSGGGVFVHLLTCSMLRSTCLLDMITHTFGWEDVNVFVHLLTCSMLRSACLLDMITHTFGWGMLTSLCTCSHVWCYAQHLLFAWLYIPPTSFMLRSACLFYMITVDVLPEKWEDNMEQWLMESFTGPAVEVSPKSEEYDVVTRCGSGVVVAVVQQLDANGCHGESIRNAGLKEPTIWWRCHLIIWECHLGIYYGLLWYNRSTQSLSSPKLT